MANDTGEVVISMQDLREVARFAAESAQEVLDIFEQADPADSRPRDALDAAWAFARGGRRGKQLRDTGWAALRAAREVPAEAADNAARAVMSAAAAAYLHPLSKPDQVKHILGAAAYAARAAELAASDDREVGAEFLERAYQRATPELVDVLSRYPAPPAGGGRVGEMVRTLDSRLRGKNSEGIGGRDGDRR